MNSSGQDRARRGGCGIVGGFLVVLAGAMGAAGVEAQATITLDQAVERALERSPQYAQATAAFRNAEGGRRTALGSFLPSLSLSSGASTRSQNQFDPTTQRVVAGSASSYNASLSASATVFEGGRRFRDWDRAQADLAAADADRTDARFGVVLQTQTLYFNALRQAELLEVQRSRVERAEESLGNIRRQIQLGAATRSDTLRARLEVANARQAELQAEVALRGARFALGRQVGEDSPVAPVAPTDMDPRALLLSEEEIYALAENESPGVHAARANQTAANASVGAARTAYWPSVRVNSGYSWANDVAAFADGNTSWSLGLSMSVPVFNGFTREENINRAEQTARVASLQEEDARLAAREQADAALQALQTAERATEIAQEAVLVAREDLRVVQERYRLGVGTILDLITSQIAVEQAEADLVSARYDYVLARAQLGALLGREL